MKLSNPVTLYILTLVAVVFAMPTARADEIVWGINASAPSVTAHIDAIDITTGALATTGCGTLSVCDFAAPNAAAAALDGRGIAINGATNTIYYGGAGSNNIYKATTGGLDGGIAFAAVDAAGIPLSGIQTITFDGTYLWVTDNSTVGNIYRYNLTGGKPTLTVKGLGLGGPLGLNGFQDGVEYIGNNEFVANRGDGSAPYDLYTLSPSSSTLASLTLTTPQFLKLPTVTTGTFTGVTFDGTHYFVANPVGYNGGTTGGIMEFDSTGAFIKEITLTGGLQPLVGGGTGWNLEDLASIGNTSSLPPTTNPVPEPGAVMLLGTAVLGLSWLFRRRSIPNK